MNQATHQSMPADAPSDPCPLQLPGQHNNTKHGMGAVGQLSSTSCFSHEQAVSRTHGAIHHTPTCPKGVSSHMPPHTALGCTPETGTGHASCGADAAGHDNTLYCGAGQADAFLALSFEQLVVVSSGRAVDLVRCGPAHPHVQGSTCLVPCKTEDTENMFLLDSMCGRLCRWLRSAHIGYPESLGYRSSLLTIL